MTAFLLAESGIATPLPEGAFRVGRDPRANLSFHGVPGLAPFHFEIIRSRKGHLARRLDAQAQLWVNNKPVSDAQLQSGDVIAAGSMILIYCNDVPIPASGATFVGRGPATALPAKAGMGGEFLLSRLIALITTVVATAFTYSFLCNMGWVIFLLGSLAIGHAAGWLAGLIGDELDKNLGSIAAAGALTGVLLINTLTVAGVMNMYQVVEVPSKITEAKVSGTQSNSPDKEDGEDEVPQLGTGETARKVASFSLGEALQRFLPAPEASVSRIIPATGFMDILLGLKSLLAYFIIPLASCHRARRTRTEILPAVRGRR